MRKRPIYLVALSAALALVSWMNVQAQGSQKPRTKAEQEAWMKAHPEEVQTTPPSLSNQASSRAATKADKPSLVESPKAGRSSNVDPMGGSAPAETSRETQPVKSVSIPQSTMKDAEIPAHYQQAADYKDPAVRARLEQDLKGGAKPAPASGSSTKSVQTAPQAVAGPAEYGQVNAKGNDSPVYQDTGHPEADMAAYSRAKDEWTRANDEKARQQNPEYRLLQDKIRLNQEAEARLQRVRDQEAAEEAAALAQKQLENQSTEK